MWVCVCVCVETTTFYYDSEQQSHMYTDIYYFHLNFSLERECVARNEQRAVLSEQPAT